MPVCAALKPKETETGFFKAITSLSHVGRSHLKV